MKFSTTSDLVGDLTRGELNFTLSLELSWDFTFSFWTLTWEFKLSADYGLQKIFGEGSWDWTAEWNCDPCLESI